MSNWVRLGFDSRCVRNWDDGTVVYNVLSGETHVLGNLAGIALEKIAEGSATTDSILSELISLLPDVEPRQLREELDALLFEMARLGVIAPEPA